MADDPTGMGHAGTRDPNAVRAGRARGALKAVAERIPGTRSRKDMLQERQDESTARQARVQFETMKQLEAQAQQKEGSTAANVDISVLEGRYTEEFNNLLLKALRQGQSRTEQGVTGGSLIREVICSKEFIEAITNASIKTPEEEVDKEYKKEMMGRRRRLAAELTQARENRQYMLGSFSAHELDIIYTTIMGTAIRPEAAPGEQKPRKWYKPWTWRRKKERKAEDAKPETIGAVALWNTNRSWPEGLPRPPEAFLIFLESMAIRHYGDSKGRFIGNVLADLASRRSFTGQDGGAERTLMDSARINDYLYSKSSYPIDSTKEGFHSLAVSLLETPTDSMHDVLNVPGLGYSEGYQKELAKKHNLVAEARGWVAQADSVLAQAEGAKTQAEGAHTTLAGIIATARKDGKNIKLADGKSVSPDSQEVREALKATEKEVETAKEAVLSAIAGKAKVAYELERREEEVRKFQDMHSPAAFAKELADHLRDLIVANKEISADLGTVADTIALRLPNPAVDKLLNTVEGMVDRMQDVQVHGFTPLTSAQDQVKLLGDVGDKAKKLHAYAVAAGDEEAAKLVDEKLGRPLDIEEKTREIFKHKKDEFDAEVKKLGDSIEAAALPEEVKVRLRALHKSMDSLIYPGDGPVSVKAQVMSIREDYGLPLKKAAKHVVKSLSERGYGNLAGITDAEKIIARMAFEARKPGVEPAFAKETGWWTKFWTGFRYQLLSTDAWVGTSKDAGGRVRGRLIRLWKYTLADDFASLHPKNFFQRGYGKRPDKTRYRYRLPRGVEGMWGLFWKGYIVGAALTGYMITRHDWHWYNPVSWVGYGVTTPIYEAISGKPLYIKDREWYIPATWFVPLQSEREIIRVVDDHYDIPSRLSGRGSEYYRNTYGVGARQLENESDGAGKAARLQWLQKNGDVLRFFQERASGWMDVRARSLKQGPDTCSVRGRPIPQSCEHPGLGLKTMEQIRDYTPVANDGWMPGMKVCCTIEVERRRVPDGLRLNTSNSDMFVDELMAAQRGGIKIDYAYLTRRANMMRWTGEWYLITPGEADIVSNFRISERDNVRFLLMQGADASALILPMCAQEALSPKFLKQQQRDAFVTAWRSELEKALTGTDPLVHDLTSEDLERTFKTVEAAHGAWFEDRTQEYNRRKVLDQVRDLQLQTETAIDVLVAQEDILNLVKQFTGASRYVVTPERSDEFVQILDQHRRVGGSLSDYNPFTSEPEAATRVQWAVRMGYLTDRNASELTPEAVSTSAPAAGSAAPTAAVAPNPIPEFTQQARTFYGNTANEGFRNYLDGIVSALFDDTGQDGRSMAAVQSTRFANNRDAMVTGIKAEMYRFFTSTAGPDVSRRTSYGLVFAGQGEALEVTVNNPRRARDSLRSHIIQFVRRLESTAPPPAR